ncbi:universal stress protein UspA [Pelobium manganitolerans]|uniref:Universal stress protein UspA n=1 Tax=Pelobium manganitolerans TaxID=1842495 RepID=A0A419S3R1_9SPHI|nr:universal stress protein [Pelobium manganitolerans]RKD14300.1 universal stress protein UspA [Pelobium manganitolerans]
MENPITFNRVLIAVDDSKYAYQAASYGFALAQKIGAKVALVHINQVPIATNVTGDPILGDPGIILPNMMDIQQENAKHLFADMREKYAAGADVDEYILIGDVSTEVVSLAKEQNFSMIIIGTHSRKGFDHFISGSIAESVSRHAKCPVLIIPSKD